MPDSESSDEEIWNLMIQPSVVVDIGYTDHQRVYAGPDAESGIIGTFHGQTQALEVLEIRDEEGSVLAGNCRGHLHRSLHQGQLGLFHGLPVLTVHNGALYASGMGLRQQQPRGKDGKKYS